MSERKKKMANPSPKTDARDALLRIMAKQYPGFMLGVDFVIIYAPTSVDEKGEALTTERAAKSINMHDKTIYAEVRYVAICHDRVQVDVSDGYPEWYTPAPEMVD